MPSDSPTEAFARGEHDYLLPLVEHLKLREVARKTSLPTWAAIDYKSGCLLVRFEYERGLMSLCVASTTEPDRFWPVEIVAELFPRIRLMPGGLQRLSLDEQRSFLLEHVEKLQQLFAATQYASTREKLQRVGT